MPPRARPASQREILEDIAWLTAKNRSPDPTTPKRLVGTMRWVKHDRVFFYELLAVEQEGDTVHLRIKHFHPKLVGWEERDRAAEWLLVHRVGREAAFLELDVPAVRWAVYRRESDDRLVSYFATGGEAITTHGLFAYERAAG